MSDRQEADDIAKSRFFIIGSVRLLGAILVVFGLLAVNGTLDWPAPIGYALLAIGLLDFFIFPLMLARRWRSPPE